MKKIIGISSAAKKVMTNCAFCEGGKWVDSLRKKHDTERCFGKSYRRSQIHP